MTETNASAAKATETLIERKPPTRAQRETRAVAALLKKQLFAPGLFGWEREQMALMITRVVLDVEDGKA